MPAGNHGSCIHQVSPVQVDEYNYHDSLQAHLIEGIGHSCQDLRDLPQNPQKDFSQRTGPCNALYSHAQILKYKIP